MGQYSFQEVMKQWRRFCKSHNNCGECEFDGKGICGEAHLTDIPYADIELRIMSWAAEHPEPVYPTWMEWLTDVGAIPKAISWDEPLVEAVYDAIQNYIPADIAQKLGIEPKEVSK